MSRFYQLAPAMLLAASACGGTVTTRHRQGDDGGGGAGGNGGDGGSGGASGAGGASGSGGSGGGGPRAPGWNVVPSGTAQNLYGVDFADADHGWVVGAGATLLRTSDSGGVWDGLPFGTFVATNPSKQPSSHVLMPYGADSTHTLLDVHAVSKTVLWTSSRKPIKQPPDNKDPDTLSAAFKSEDGGGSWTRVSLSTNFEIWGVWGFSGSSARAVSIGSPTHPDSDAFLIESSTDMGRARQSFAGLRDLVFVEAKVGYAAGKGYVFKSTDGGQSWAGQMTPFAQYWSVAAVDATHLWAVGETDKIAMSDGGGTWTGVASGAKAALYGVSFADPKNGWVVGKGGQILRSEDGGMTWKAETSGVSVDLHRVKALSPTVAWVVGDKGTLLVRQ